MLRVLVIPRPNGGFVAQVIEHDLSAQGSTLDGLNYNLQGTLAGSLVVEDCSLYDLPNAPAQFESQWDLGTPLPDASKHFPGVPDYQSRLSQS